MKTFVLIGHPVAHSISPAIHGAAYRALALSDCEYVAVDCPDRAAVEAQVARLRRGEISGANVTVPWKRVALSLADEADPVARATGAANVLAPVRGAASVRIVAYNTDVLALADELARARPGARRGIVLGSGGAALAAVVACRSIGVSALVTARKWIGGAERFIGAEEFRALGATPIPWSTETTKVSFRAALSDVDLIVQSTSAGMKGAEPGEGVRDIVPWDALRRDAFVYDLVYNPPVTPILLAAKSRGIEGDSGLGMLVGQAARAFSIWLGVPAPVEAMHDAALRALFPEAQA